MSDKDRNWERLRDKADKLEKQLNGWRLVASGWQDLALQYQGEALEYRDLLLQVGINPRRARSSDPDSIPPMVVVGNDHSGLSDDEGV